MEDQICTECFKTLRVRLAAVGIIFSLLSSVGATPAEAQSGKQTSARRETVNVLGRKITPQKGLFQAIKDVNVRAGPGTRFARVGGLNAGEQVRVIGKTAGGAWLAVRRDGVTLGFVYAQALVPILHGALDKEFFGSYPVPGKGPATRPDVACSYRFRFEREVAVEGEVFKTADYEVRFRCAAKHAATIFYAHMFLIESPVDRRKNLYQIGLEARSIGDGFEKYLITTYLYNPKTGTVTFDGHSMPHFARPPKVRTFKTTSLKEALKQILDTSITGWTKKAWDSIFAKAR